MQKLFLLFIFLSLLGVVSGYAQRPVIAEDFKNAKIKSITEKHYDWDEKAKLFKPSKQIPIFWRWHYDKNGFIEKEEQYDINGKGNIDAYQEYERDYSGRVLRIKWYDIIDGKPEYSQYSIVEYQGDTAAVFQSYDSKTKEKTGITKTPLDSKNEQDLKRCRIVYFSGGNKIAKIQYQIDGTEKTVFYRYNQNGTVEETENHFGQSNRKICKYLYGWLKTEEIVHNIDGKITAKYVYEIEYYK